MVELQPGNFRPWYELALLQLAADERQSYGETCRKMIESIPPSGMPLIEQFVCWTCSVGRCGTGRLECDHRARRICGGVPPDFDAVPEWAGAACLRAGLYGAAYEELIEADRLLTEPSSTMLSSPAYPWYLLAITCKHLGLDEEAESWYQKARQWHDEVTATENAKIFWNRQATLDLLGEQASALLQADVAIDEESPQVWLGRSAADYRRGAVEAARESLERAVACSGENPGPWVRRAVWRQKAGKTRAAEVAGLERGVALRPWDIEAWMELLEFQRRIGDEERLQSTIQAAVAACVAVVHVSDNTPSSISQLAQKLAAWGFTEESNTVSDQSIAIPSRVLAVNPNDCRAMRQRAEAYANLKQWDKAIEDYSHVIALCPEDSDAWKDRTVARNALRQYKRVIADADEVIRLAPTDYWGYKIRAGAYTAIADYSQAIADYGQAIRLKPKNSTLYVLRGEAYLALVDTTKPWPTVANTLR